MDSSPRQSSFSLLALALVALLALALLAAVILAVRLPASGDLDATPTPPDTPTPPIVGTAVAPYQGLPVGAVMTAEQVGDIPPQTRISIGGITTSDQGALFYVTTLDGLLTAEAYEHQLMLAPDYDPGMPIDMPRYGDSGYWTECFPLVLTEDIPLLEPRSDLPLIYAGTHVRISSYEALPRYVEGRGYMYHYTVVMQPPDGTVPAPEGPFIGGVAHEGQLALAPDVVVVEGQPTPVSPFLEIGMGAFFTTIEQVGDIPPETLVGIGSAYYGCNAWNYQIVTADGGLFAWANEHQIAYAPGITPGAGTPQIALIEATPPPTPTAPTITAIAISDPTYLYPEPSLNQTPIAEVAVDSFLWIASAWPEANWYEVYSPEVSTGPLWVHGRDIDIEGDPSLIPTAGPTYTPLLAYTIGDPVTVIRVGPGLEYDALFDAPPDTELLILGEWKGYDWYKVQYGNTPDSIGWVYAGLVRVEGDVSTIPAADPMPPDTPPPYPTPTP